jgi:hypothetical protein
MILLVYFISNYILLNLLIFAKFYLNLTIIIATPAINAAPNNPFP